MKQYVNGLSLSDEEITNLTLVEIEKLLQNNHRNLFDYPRMPKPLGYLIEQLGNKRTYEQRNYNPVGQLYEFNPLYQHLTCIIKFSRLQIK